MIRKLIGRVFAWLGVLVVFGLSVARTMLDLIGYTTARGDAAGIPQFTQDALKTLQTIPWEILWLTFVVFFMWLVWWSWSPATVPTTTLAKPSKPQRDKYEKVLIGLTNIRTRLGQFQRRIDTGTMASNRPFEDLRRVAEEQSAIFLTLENDGFVVPRIDYNVDPMGFITGSIEYLDKLLPLLKQRHIPQARRVGTQVKV